MASPRGSVDRRRFLKLGVASAGVAATACPAGAPPADSRTVGGMRYRPLGSTALRGDAGLPERRDRRRPLPDLFTKYDFVSYPDVGRILHRASGQGIGAIVFKVDAGGRQREIRDLEKGGLSFRQATLKWALASSDVASVAVTITGFDRITECAGAVGSSLTEADSEMLGRYAREMHDKYCRFCRTCEGRCPQGAAVADVMRYAMYFSSYGREKEAMRLYAALPGGRSAAACEGCDGPCEGRCPFGRAIRAGMVAAHRQLSLTEA